ncbi:hypothetical protein N7492_000380 [Penicillium capsulatum]|uniref:DUF8035 domain-containing protein n=1 Tax=Penicillium capsulatum TaxID=69766 RepID=A0A9W9IRN3_9EURO|nr:hypothetical protein N7492_000380 [Penicillium capsulatum]KAJ6130556.1 hypothetical protein N7512_003336 [Penicillium capsulatum]
MSRHAPPPEYYEDDPSEFERDPHPRSRRRDREFEEDMEYHRRRSMPPVEDLERLRLRARPSRERDRVASRRSREDLNEDISGSELEEVRMRPRPRRRSHLSREVEEEMILADRERRGGRRSRPRDVEEEELVVHDREPRGSRKYRPREVDEEELVLERGHRLPPRRRSREVEEDLIVDDREFRGGRKHRPREVDEEELILDERDRRGGRRHRPRELDEDELVVDARKPRGGRKHQPPAVDDADEDLIIEDRHRRRRPRADRDLEEEMVVHRKGRYPPRPYDSEGDLRLRERRFEDEQDGMYIPPRRRPRPRGSELDEMIIDDRERDRVRGGKYREESRPKEEVVMRWKDRPSSQDLDEEEELHMRETHRRRRRSHPESGNMRDLPGAWPEDREEGFRIQSRTRARPRRFEAEDEEEIAIRGGKSDQELRRGSADSEEIMLDKEKRKPSPRDRSPSVEPVRAPPIHQDVITHHRHIDHGFDPPPHAPSPDISSTRTSFDEADVHRRTQGNQEFEDQSDDESVSPTSRPSVDFNNPWKADKVSVKGKSKSLDDSNDSMMAASTHTRRQRCLSPDDNEDKSSRYDNRSLADDSAKDVTDEWSVVRTPSKAEALEMTGALDIVEVAPKDSSEPEIEVEEEESHVGWNPSKDSKKRRDERWTEITKDLVVREAIERLGYEFEETRMFYYIFSYLDSNDIDELVELSDEIRRTRRRRIREMHRERSTIPPRPPSLFDRIPPRPMMPPRPRMPVERPMREREWLHSARR